MSTLPTEDRFRVISPRRVSRRTFLRGALGAAIALPAAGAWLAAGARTASAAPAGGTAVIAVAASPTSWDLTKADWITWNGIKHLYDTLLMTDEGSVWMISRN